MGPGPKQIDHAGGLRQLTDKAQVGKQPFRECQQSRAHQDFKNRQAPGDGARGKESLKWSQSPGSRKQGRRAAHKEPAGKGKGKELQESALSSSLNSLRGVSLCL